MRVSAEDTLRQVLAGQSDGNVRFVELIALLEALGFRVRIRGSHHILTRSGVSEILNLQPQRSLAKRYQVRQVRSVILKYGLVDELDA